MTTLSQQFVQPLAELRFEDLTDSSLSAVKERCIDYLGSLAGGVHEGELARILLADLKAGSRFSGESSVLGTPYRTDAAQAALLNGVTGHSLELDDGHRKAYGHPAVVVFSAIFPLAEKLQSSGKEFLLASIVGYEAFVRLGRACNPGMLRRGWHTSGAAGCLAAALASAKLMGLDAKGMLHAMAIAGLFASGLSITFHSGGTLKPLNTGRAAYNGVTAAHMASLGAEGAPDILEGKNGFFHAYSGQDIPEDILLAPLAPPFAVEGSYVKFYPSCRYAHASIDAAIALRDKVNLDDIREIVVTTYPTAIYLAARSELPSDLATARFNIGFAVSLALVKGQLTVADFDPENGKDPRVRALFEKIRFVEDPAYDSPENNIRGAAMDIYTSASTVSLQVPLPVGEPENPAPCEMYAGKFSDLASSIWDEAQQAVILNDIDNLEALQDVTTLIKIMSVTA